MAICTKAVSAKALRIAPAVLAAPTTISLPVPEKEKVTFRWLIENVSYPVWVVLGTLLIGAVGVGRLFH